MDREDWLFLLVAILLVVDVALSIAVGCSIPPFFTEKKALQSEIARIGKQKEYLLEQRRMDEYDFWDGIERQLVERSRSGDGK